MASNHTFLKICNILLAVLFVKIETHFHELFMFVFCHLSRAILIYLIPVKMLLVSYNL